MTNQQAMPMLPKLSEVESMDIQEIVRDVEPLAHQALGAAATVDETNEVRIRIEGLVKYLNKRLPIGQRIKRALKSVFRGRGHR